MGRLLPALSATLLGLGLLLLPVAVTHGDHGSLAFAAGNGGGNGGGNAGGNGGGNGGGNAGGNGNGNGHSASADAGKATGRDTAPGQDPDKVRGASAIAKTDPMHPSNLGRLNGFMNASSVALANTSDNSAIGAISKTYRDMLSDYFGATPNDPNAPALDDLAAALAAAANKELSAEQVDAINDRVAAENPDDPNLSDLANPANDPAIEAQNQVLAAELATRANEIQHQEQNQGLGQALDDLVSAIF